jgi:hypothetical protein
MLLSFKRLALSASMLSFHAACWALNATSEAYCRVYPDPHFQTWHGGWYDYHGDCDLVLIKSNLLDLHIRTKGNPGWSGVEYAALGIGSDLLEVQPSDILLNSVPTTGGTVGGYTFTVVGDVINIDLYGAQYVEIQRTYSGTLTITALGHGSNFEDATAMCGHWKADLPKELVGRDGTTVYDKLTENIDFGEEWQVDLSLDPNLFQTPGEPNCTYINGTDRIPDFKNVCADVPEERGLKENCEFDVETTFDSNWASQPAYVSPIVADPESQCIEASGSDCADKGGKCVWRCVTTESFCDQELCKGKEGFDENEGDVGDDVVDGCACEFPREACRRVRFFDGFMMHRQFRRRCRQFCVTRFFGLWERFGFLYGGC